MKKITPIAPKDLIRQMGRITRLPLPEPVRFIEKIDESLTPNMRALRMVMTISGELLSMGVAASDVVHMALGITNTYCKRKVHIDVSFTQITISQDRGVDREPLTLVRTIVPDDANYQVIQALQSLALQIRDKHLPLDEAEKRTQEIVSKPKQLNQALIFAAGGAVSAGVVALYDGSWLMVGLAFLLGMLCTILLRWMAKAGITTFYSQIIAALFVTLTAALVAWINVSINLPINPTLLVIGGIVLLVAGLMIVGAFQDAIDEYYVTANARLLKVVIATSGIVIGVTGGLYIATRLGVSFPATPDRLSMADKETQYIAALMIAAAFATRNHARFFGTVISGGVGMLGWWISQQMLYLGFGVILASGAAATIIGLMATFVSRFWRFPSLAIIAAGIVPLVPGLSLYNGLMGVVTYSPNDPSFPNAITVLLQAIMIGLAVAAGASLGNMLGRPLRRRFIKLYNKLPIH